LKISWTDLTTHLITPRIVEGAVLIPRTFQTNPRICSVILKRVL